MILFKYTSRSRVDKFFRGLDSIVNNINDNDYWVQCTFDLDDVMFNPEIIKRLNSYKNISYYFGESLSKIDAINKNLDKLPKFDILVNMSDDFIFIMKGFNSIIKEAMQTYFQDTDGFLHFPDGNQNRLSTMSIVGRKYFERSGYIYHKSYLTEYCDNEEQEKAIRLNKYKYMGDDVKIMSHINPYHGHGGTMDDLYTRNAAYSQIDRDNYFKRLSENFYL